MFLYMIFFSQRLPTEPAAANIYTRKLSHVLTPEMMAFFASILSIWSQWSLACSHILLADWLMVAIIVVQLGDDSFILPTAQENSD